MRKNFTWWKEQKILFNKNLESLTLVHESSCITKNELLSVIAISLGRILWHFAVHLNKNKIKVTFRSNSNKTKQNLNMAFNDLSSLQTVHLVSWGTDATTISLTEFISEEISKNLDMQIYENEIHGK